MKKYFLSFAVCFIVAAAIAQPGKPAAKTSATLEAHKKVLKMAQRNGDAGVALASLYYIIAEEGEKSLYKDTLAITYFTMGSYEQCALVAGEIVATNGDSIEKGQKLVILEILAIAQTSLEKYKEAIASYERLLPKTNEMLHAYRLAELQFNYKRVGEALQTIQKAETLNNSMEGPVAIDMGENRVQKVALEAAIYNLKGYILLEEYPDQRAQAIEAFKKALEIQPDFILAKNNLEYANAGEPEKK